MVEQVGRNDPCPCGSGKKYKKCCGLPGMKKHTVSVIKEGAQERLLEKIHQISHQAEEKHDQFSQHHFGILDKQLDTYTKEEKKVDQ